MYLAECSNSKIDKFACKLNTLKPLLSVVIIYLNISFFVFVGNNIKCEFLECLNLYLDGSSVGGQNKKKRFIEIWCVVFTYHEVFIDKKWEIFLLQFFEWFYIL